MARYVDAYSLAGKVSESKRNNPHADGIVRKTHNHEHEHFLRLIAAEPTADVTEMIHAKWIISSSGYFPYCSNCKTEPKNGVMSKYCPECGAKMDLKEGA